MYKWSFGGNFQFILIWSDMKWISVCCSVDVCRDGWWILLPHIAADFIGGLCPFLECQLVRPTVRYNTGTCVHVFVHVFVHVVVTDTYTCTQ